MKITYDPTVDALTIVFHHAEVKTEHITDDIAFDYDAEGHLASIEVLDASKHFSTLDELKTLEFREYATSRD